MIPIPDTIQFDADIAIFSNPEKIFFSAYVLPICLWKSENEMPTSVGIIVVYKG